MQIEDQPVAASTPAEHERLPPVAPIRKRDPDRDQGVDDPDDGDQAHEPDAEFEPEPIGQMQAVMQFVEEGQQVLARERDLAPFAPRQDAAVGRIDDDLVVARFKGLPRGRIEARLDKNRERFACRRGERQITHPDARIGLLDARREF